MSGRVIVFEGGDGSGKATQAQLLSKRLMVEGYQVKSVTFPNYESDAAAPVRMYLSGVFGTEPDAVSPFVASTFYAIDRFASYRQDWQSFYEDGGIIIADRYVTSNMVHQMVKCKDGFEMEEFLGWLDDLEYEKFLLPRPDLVFLLDVPPVLSGRLLGERLIRKDSQSTVKDIHEQDDAYLKRCYSAYDMLAERYGWNRIYCTENGKMRTIDDIHESVYLLVQSILK